MNLFRKRIDGNYFIRDRINCKPGLTFNTGFLYNIFPVANNGMYTDIEFVGNFLVRKSMNQLNKHF